MTELENQEILHAVIELLKTQMLYVRNLHEALSVLCVALEKDFPQLQENQKVEMVKIRENAGQQLQLHEADELLQRLAKVQR